MQGWPPYCQEGHQGATAVPGIHGLLEKSHPLSLSDSVSSFGWFLRCQIVCGIFYRLQIKSRVRRRRRLGVAGEGGTVRGGGGDGSVGGGGERGGVSDEGQKKELR